MRLSPRRLRKHVDCDHLQMFDGKQADSGMIYFVCLFILSIIPVCEKAKRVSDKNSEYEMSQSLCSGLQVLQRRITGYGSWRQFAMFYYNTTSFQAAVD